MNAPGNDSQTGSRPDPDDPVLEGTQILSREHAVAPRAPKEEQRESAPPPRRRKSCGRWVFGLAVVFLVLATWITWRVVTSPKFLRSVALDALRSEVKGEVAIGEVRLRSLSQLQVRDVALSRKGAKEPDISVKFIRLTLNPWALLSGEVDLRSAAIVDPLCRLYFGPGDSMNLDELFPPSPPKGETTKAPDRSADGLLADGVTFENGTVIWRSRAILGDDAPRRIDGLYGTWRRAPSSIAMQEFSGVIRRPPLLGARFAGWARVTDPAEFRLRVSALGLRLTPGLTRNLPYVLRRRFDPLQPVGYVSLNATVDWRDQQELDYFLELEVCGCGIAIPGTPLRVEGIHGSARVVPSAINLTCDSGLFCGGRANGSVSLAQIPNGSQRLRGFLSFEGVSIREIMKRAAPKEKPRPGELAGWLRIAGDPAKPATLLAEGRVDLQRAELLALPVFTKILALINLSVRSTEVIQSGFLRFQVDFAKKRLVARELRLLSPNVQLVGVGWVGFDGKVKLRVLVSIPKTEATGVFSMLKSVYNSVVAGVQSVVTPPIEVTGTLKEPQAEMQTLRYYGKPVTDLFDLLTPTASKKKPATK